MTTDPAPPSADPTTQDATPRQDRNYEKARATAKRYIDSFAPWDLSNLARCFDEADKALEQARTAMQEFNDKCDRGEARSRRSYAAFTAVLAVIAALTGRK